MQRRKNTKSWASPLSNLQAGSPAVMGVVMSGVCQPQWSLWGLTRSKLGWGPNLGRGEGDFSDGSAPDCRPVLAGCVQGAGMLSPGLALWCLFWAVDPMREKLSSCFFLTLTRFTWFLWLVSRGVVWGLLRGEAAFHVWREFGHPLLVTWWSRLKLYRLFRENAESFEHLCMLFY